MTNETALLHAILREDFAAFTRKVFQTLHGNTAFCDAPYIAAMAHQLTQIAHGNATRLIINIPPRHLKSIMASVALSAYVLGRYPESKILCVSYSEELAVDLSKKTREIMQSDWYIALFPQSVLLEQTQDRLKTVAGGERRAVSMGGSITGFGADLIILDDPQKADDVSSLTRREQSVQTLENTIMSRLNEPVVGRIVIVQQRLHEADISGVVRDKGGWTHLSLPAIAEVAEAIPLGHNKVWKRAVDEVLDPLRFPLTVLNDLKKEIGPLTFATQYQQQPAVKGGFIAPWSWFRRYPFPKSPGHPEHVLQSWDVAASAGPHGNFSACTTWYYINHCLYLVDVHRVKLTPHELMKYALAWAGKWKVTHWMIEASGVGFGLYTYLYANRGDRLCSHLKPTTSKEERLLKISHLVEQGRVWLPKEAAWLADFRSEWSNFPNGKHDDQVDSVTQAVLWMVIRSRRRRSIGCRSRKWKR